MELITDRTQTDVLLRTPKGCYGAEDLNRVESAVRTLADEMAALGEHCPPLTTRTDWQFTALFDPNRWVTAEQMERYLNNVRLLAAAYGLQPVLPSSMERLDWQGANRIEQQLALLEKYIENQKSARQFCGAAECGG